MTPVSLDNLYGFADIARRNGTESAFIDVALQWAAAADAEILRLQKERDQLKSQLETLNTLIDDIY